MSEIHTTPSERLVQMANQIARAFSPVGEARAVPKIAEHIEAFWDPRMRRKIDEIVTGGGAGLDPLALAALERLGKAGSGAASAAPVAEAVAAVPAAGVTAAAVAGAGAGDAGSGHHDHAEGAARSGLFPGWFKRR